MFIDDLRQAVRRNESLPLLLDSCIHAPKQHQNPLVTAAIAMFGEDKVKEHILNAVKDNLYTVIRDNQSSLELLNSDAGRAYLHSQLDSLLSFLVSAKFSRQYTCPNCKKQFRSKLDACPACNVKLKWK